MEKAKTTISDRLEGGVFFGAMGAASMAAFIAVAQGIKTFAFKKGKFRFNATDWKFVAGVSAISAVLGFLSTNTALESKVENAYIDAANELNDPKNHASKQEKEQKFNATVENIMNGKIPAEKTSTKFRDMVDVSRTQHDTQRGA